ncbi:DUF1351 domain-containing protein [Levilactobacillus enshiensis]|uniref:DUF1351 domain-containing protein n=1 Tax=Levilactobacillus enshiensis TaxID=2590213 RepID=UPI00117A3CD1|nr:DUF1351 domain-containing protein [Levilactobacillus enshiensis]
MANNELVDFKPSIEVNPSPIVINNREQVEKAIDEVVAKYGQDFVVTADNITETKKMRTHINKIMKAVNDTRLATNREYKKPIAEFDAIMNGYKDRIKAIIDPLDEKITEVAEQERQARYKLVTDTIAEMAPNYGVSASDIEVRPAWLNKAATNSADTALTKSTIDEIAADMTQLKKDQDQRATDIETIKTYADQMDIEPAGWAALLNQGVSLTDIFKQINQAAAKRDQEVKEKADREAKHKEAQAAIDATHQVKQGGETIDTDTGEVVPQSITVKLTGTHKALGQVWAGAKQLGVKVELVKEEG